MFVEGVRACRRGRFDTRDGVLVDSSVVMDGQLLPLAWLVC